MNNKQDKNSPYKQHTKDVYECVYNFDMYVNNVNAMHMSYTQIFKILISTVKYTAF